ncbi:MAG: hypothetical protein ACRBK7_08175 [Acidimicrobiales bacterium]
MHNICPTEFGEALGREIAQQSARNPNLSFRNALRDGVNGQGFTQDQAVEAVQAALTSSRGTANVVDGPGGTRVLFGNLPPRAGTPGLIVDADGVVHSGALDLDIVDGEIVSNAVTYLD